MAKTSIPRNLFLEHLNQFFSINSWKDYCPNGLQVQGKDQLKKIGLAVTASLEVINWALEQQLDALIVHHGIIWQKDPASITGNYFNKVKKLLHHEINLIAYHLPLDGNLDIGHGATIARILGLGDLAAFPVSLENAKEVGKNAPVGVRAQLDQVISIEDFTKRILALRPYKELIAVGPKGKIDIHQRQKNDAQSKNEQGKNELLTPQTDSVVIVTGAGQSYLKEAHQQGAKVFISGEISEEAWHWAQEQQMYYFALGHHFSEEFGMIALKDKLQLWYPDMEISWFATEVLS